jgi:hypothetical protein
VPTLKTGRREPPHTLHRRLLPLRQARGYRTPRAGKAGPRVIRDLAPGDRTRRSGPRVRGSRCVRRRSSPRSSSSARRPRIRRSSSAARRASDSTSERRRGRTPTGRPGLAAPPQKREAPEDLIRRTADTAPLRPAPHRHGPDRAEELRGSRTTPPAHHRIRATPHLRQGPGLPPEGQTATTKAPPASDAAASPPTAAPPAPCWPPGPGPAPRTAGDRTATHPTRHTANPLIGAPSRAFHNLSRALHRAVVGQSLPHSSLPVGKS